MIKDKNKLKKYLKIIDLIQALAAMLILFTIITGVIRFCLISKTFLAKFMISIVTWIFVIILAFIGYACYKIEDKIKNNIDD